MKKEIDYKKQGKKNRVSGADFERRVRADLESKGWIVSKWQNNVDLKENKCIPSKRKYNPFNKAYAIGTGFPDFIVYKRVCLHKIIPPTIIDFENEKEFKKMKKEFDKLNKRNPTEFVLNNTTEVKISYKIIFVECKVGRYLDKIEKEKAKWYLENKFCSKFLVAFKTKEGRKVVVDYKEIKLGDLI